MNDNQSTKSSTKWVIYVIGSVVVSLCVILLLSLTALRVVLPILQQRHEAAHRQISAVNAKSMSIAVQNYEAFVLDDKGELSR